MVTSVYGRINAALYDRDETRHAMRAFYLDRWRRAGAPTPVLDPMCGTGFFLIPFLEAGTDIDGVDASAPMLDRCRQKCARKGLTPRLYHQPLEALALPRQYGFALIPDRSFAMIYRQDAARTCLRNVWDQLQPRGWLVLDLKPSARPGEFGAPGHIDYGLEDWSDGSTIVTTSIWGEREHGRVLRNVTKFERFVAGALVETEVFDYNERWYSQAEATTLLRAVGFTDIHITKGYDDCDPTEDDIFVLTCRKP